MPTLRMSRLTFSLVDGGGLVGGASVCVAFDTQQTLPTASRSGLRVPSISTASFLGLTSAAWSTEEEATSGYTMAVNRCRGEGGDVCVCHLL